MSTLFKISLGLVIIGMAILIACFACVSAIIVQDHFREVAAIDWVWFDVCWFFTTLLVLHVKFFFPRPPDDGGFFMKTRSRATIFFMRTMSVAIMFSLSCALSFRTCSD
jgi:hypothetical protein